MMIHEVLQQTGLTRKSIEYYIDQKLIRPKIKENGYREFSEEDISLLKSIAVYRRLGVPVSQIREILDGRTQAINDIIVHNRISAQQMQKKDELLKRLLHGASADEILPEIRIMEAGDSIAQRLINAFPGYFGRYLSLHFASFLSCVVENNEQMEAYETIVSWLDALEALELPKDLQEYLDKATEEMYPEQMEEMQAVVLRMSEDPTAYFQAHRDEICRYLELKDTAEYRNSPAARLMEVITAFQRQNGYTEVFIPAMERLSPQYAAYRKRIQTANEIFAEVMNR